jgi:hypothetical protein
LEKVLWLHRSRVVPSESLVLSTKYLELRKSTQVTYPAGVLRTDYEARRIQPKFYALGTKLAESTSVICSREVLSTSFVGRGELKVRRRRTKC